MQPIKISPIATYDRNHTEGWLYTFIIAKIIYFVNAREQACGELYVCGWFLVDKSLDPFIKFWPA